MAIREPAEAVALDYMAHAYPTCKVGLLAGSVVRGQGTPRSDLDIFIIDNQFPSSFRESLHYKNWPVECFVHNDRSYQAFFENDCERARPSLPQMVSEGIVLKDDGFAEKIKAEAKALLKKGPKSWTQEELKIKRYFLTDLLDDFEGCKDRSEGIFIAGKLAEAAHEFVLRTNGQWIGSGKWIKRALDRFDSSFSKRFADAFDSYYRHDDKQQILTLIDNILQPYGGRLFEGFSLQS
ncbi:hypothetical protein EV207_13729 [Scopulibacillus darangshiensis]|uniref:Nucleotidyltransferase-like protein n=1 Tax=Scopulibacillus darangshiensis TaxID=442528 RepID=A0A4R2NKM6_9BACL|nr:nucleotidyltransferase domain-containing protein [Scopulibacillus darangshiensis]TCP22139.1 hypothetical protein EV207_13729 [Scopulibacillus darangshiensis]